MAHASRLHAARALTAICLGATATTVLSASPATAAPSVDQAQSRVDEISHDRAVVAKKAKLTDKRLAAARHGLSLASAELRTHRAALAEVEQRAAELEPSDESTFNRALSAAAEVTTAPDPVEALDEAQQELTEDAEAPGTGALQDRIDQLEAKVQRETSTVRVLVTRDRADEKRLKSLGAALARAHEVLEDAQEAAEPAEPVASGGAAAAVAYAMAQVGDSYVYGAAGPDAFDCSGLTMMAWAAGGVSLPHSSGAQMGSGTPVSIDALQPGDLVFYYSPVSHVGIYVGNGQLVHAANPGTGVQLTSVSSMPISGAVRPG